MNEYENADKKQQDMIDDINDYNKQEIDLEPVYSEEGAEDNIAPTELFEYEIINDGSVASPYMQNLPTKTARITGIKSEYIERQSIDYNSWYYKIKYEGIKDVLVIPYQAELDENGKVTKNGEIYKITEVDLSIRGDYSSRDFYTGSSRYTGSSFPSIKKVIYPNTIEKIIRDKDIGLCSALDQPSEIILSKNLKSIEDYIFNGTNIENIEIPSNVTNISKNAFSFCRSLKSIKIPKSVTSIGEYAFFDCASLESIEIPENVTNIGKYAFRDWYPAQTIYFECSEEESKNWDTNWNSYCYAKIVWNYKPGLQNN